MYVIVMLVLKTKISTKLNYQLILQGENFVF